jgi:phosphoglucosamine mutase
VLAAIKRSGQQLDEILEGLTLFPQKLINVRMQPNANWKGSAAIQAAIAHAESELEGTGRVLIRASGTEPVLRVMVEASSEKAAKHHAQTIADVVGEATA